MSEHEPIPGMEGKHDSLWLDTAEFSERDALKGDISCDVAVIGGGLTGLTCAYLLGQTGHKVAVLEMRRLMHGTSGHTTAKITSAHGLIYKYLIDTFGRERARMYADANQTAIRWINMFVAEHKLECDYKVTSAYSYTQSDEQRKAVEAEVKAAAELGLPVEFHESLALPCAVKGAIGFRDQAMFHPAKYGNALADAVVKQGGSIHERTRALEVRDGATCEVTTDKGLVRAKAVIVATMYPFLMQGEFYGKLHPKQSYVTAAVVNGPLPEGMYFSVDDYGVTLRPQPYDGGSILIFGGDVNKVGHGGDIVKRYRKLERVLRESFSVRSLEYYWLTHDALSADLVPYIGKVSPDARGLYVATGFKQWGITHAVVAAQILTDMIRGKNNPWLNLYDATRPMPKTPAGEFNLPEAHPSPGTMEGFAAKPPQDPDQLDPDTATVYEDQKVGCYREDEQKSECVSMVCTHRGCMVHWNNAERTWDCHCHGSRFSHSGEVEYGPAVKDLPEGDVKDGS